MAIALSNGNEVDVGDGVTRREVSISDISTAADIIAAASSGKRRIIGGHLDISAPASEADLEIKSGSNILYPKRIPASTAGTIEFKDLQKIISDDATAIQIESDVACSAYGILYYITGEGSPWKYNP